MRTIHPYESALSLFKSHRLYHKIQPQSDVDVAVINCGMNNEGGLLWPPIIARVLSIQVKAAYALIKKDAVVLHGLTNKKLNLLVQQCESSLLMGFDSVSALVAIATEPQGGIGSEPWTNALSLCADAYWKAEPILRSLPNADFGIAAWPIGAVGDSLSFVDRKTIAKGAHPLKVASKPTGVRKTEKDAGAGGAQVIRQARHNSRLEQQEIERHRVQLCANLTKMLGSLPKPHALPAVFVWNGKEGRLISQQLGT